MSQTCLIVAHDPWFIQLLRIYSEEIGMRVSQAYDGQDVIPMVHQEIPAVILMEEELPGKVKTCELLRTLRADPVSQRLPILVFSWQGQEMSKELGQYAISHLQAPITFESFVNALSNSGVQFPVGKHPLEINDRHDTDDDEPDQIIPQDGEN